MVNEGENSSDDDGMDDPEMIQLTELIKNMDIGGEDKPQIPTDDLEDDPEADA